MIQNNSLMIENTHQLNTRLTINTVGTVYIVDTVYKINTIQTDFNSITVSTVACMPINIVRVLEWVDAQ